MKRKIVNIILVLLSMLTIFLFSCENADKSSKTSDNFAKEVVKVITRNDEEKIKKLEPKIESYMEVIRKCAHFTEFLIFGFLLINVVKDYKKLSIKIILFSIIICALYSLSDEIHQLFIVGRAFRVFDIFVDTLGSTVGIMIYYLIYKKCFVNNKKVVDK